MKKLFVLCTLTLTMIGCGGGGGGGSKNNSSALTTSKSSSLVASSNATSSSQGVSSSSAVSSAIASSVTVSSSSKSSLPPAISSSSANSQSSSSVAASTDPVAISAEGAFDGKVAIDDQGNAIAIWRKLNSGIFGYSLWVNRYVKGTGWGEAQLLEDDGGSVDESNLYIDAASGRAVVIWEQLTSASSYDMWVRRFDPATGWSAVERIETLDTTTGLFPQAIIDGAGNVLAVWAQMDSQFGRFSIWSNRYTAGTGWGAAATIETNNVVGGMDGSPSLAWLGGGDAVAVWLASGNNRVHISTNIYSNSTGWGTAAQLVTDTGADMSLNYPTVTADGAGKALLVWGQWDFSNSKSFSNVYVKNYNNGWSTDVINIGSHEGSDLISNPFAVSNGNGVAAVTWGRKDQAVMVNTRAANGTWSQAATVKPANAESVLSVPHVGLDSAANAMLVWSQDANDRMSKDSWFSTFSIASGGWSAGQLLEPYKGTATEARVAVNSNGDRMVIWYNVTDFSNIGSQIYARYFPAGTTATP